MANHSTVSILLPVCVECSEDMFLIILKNVIARSKFEDDYVARALKSGMNAEHFYIDFNDVSVSWRKLQAKAQRIWQMKLIGFWCAENYPLLARKLFGDGWVAPKRKGVTLNAKSITARGIDSIVFQKMEIRYIELNVSQSTSKEKLKYFVKAPSAIEKYNPVQFSPKMKTFTIRSEHLETCWEALRCGQPSQPESEISLKFEICGDGGDSLAAVDIGNGHSSKRARLDYIRRSDSQNVQYGSFETMKEMQADIKSLINRLDVPSRIDSNEITRKDKEIAEKKVLLLDVTEKCAALETELDDLKKQSFIKDKQLVDINNKVIAEKSKSVEAERLSSELGQRIAKMENERNAWAMKTVDEELVDKTDQELKQCKEKLTELEGYLTGWQNYSAYQTKELEEKNECLLITKQKLKESEKKNIEMAEKITNLEQERKELTVKFDEMMVADQKTWSEKTEQLEQCLNAWVSYAGSMENEVAKTNELLICEKRKLEESEKFKCEMNDTIAKLEQERKLSVSYTKGKDRELQEANKTVNEVSENYGKLEGEFSRYKNDVATLMPELKSRIKELEKRLAGNDERMVKPYENEDNATQADHCTSSDTDNKVFVSDDPRVNKCRPLLIKLTFGWAKFSNAKNATFCPAFLHPLDVDGVKRAQKITGTGYPAYKTNEIFEFEVNVAKEKKERAQVAALKLFNAKFNFSFN